MYVETPVKDHNTNRAFPFPRARKPAPRPATLSRKELRRIVAEMIG